MQLMLVEEGVDPVLVEVPAMLAIYDEAARRALPPGYTLGERHVVDDNGTKSVVWTVRPAT